MTKEEKDAKIVDIVKLSKELGFEIGVLLNPNNVEDADVQGIIIGDKAFVQLTIDYIQLDSYVADMITKRKESVPLLPESKQNVSETKKPDDTDGKGGGSTWH